MLLLQPEQPSQTLPVGLDDLGAMKTAFATNTSVGVRPISRIDDVDLRVDDASISALQRAYAELPGETL